ncbi:Na+/H+ antiporter NhaA [uncultured Propionivibrio sp.]|uniref:Na+/H+ antiporter NhaA n=1 Tax=uncultured Propionivibrio sp. TaxID=426737 RepID=UPI0029BFD676|nr:Na+/H+ antiporter NhaA [uncultured Propionivibrio sp.]
MARISGVLTETFQRFIASERAGGYLLIAATLIAIALANSPVGPAYQAVWQGKVLGLSVEHWINDGLMAVFFLLVGLELERELYVGELSELGKAMLPLVAAVGGMLAPALAHYAFNAGTSTQGGFGIPMATDIAFALGILSLLGNRVPAALKVFVVAFAVIDDLGAILVIAVFYTADLSLAYLAAALALWAALIVLNRRRVMALPVYLGGGLLMWFCLLHSGVHATLAGVLLAFAIPFRHVRAELPSPSHRLEHALHRPVAFLVLPLFALANTGVVLTSDWASGLLSSNSLGIAAGLLLGKPVGVLLAASAAVAAGACRLPEAVGWRHLVAAGVLGGIGFTMSIFITNLAFANQPAIINAAKIAILGASSLAGTLGFLLLLRR